MTESIYRQLQERLDLYSMGFPTAESGIEIKILKYLFSEKDAGMTDWSPSRQLPRTLRECAIAVGIAAVC